MKSLMKMAGLVLLIAFCCHQAVYGVSITSPVELDDSTNQFDDQADMLVETEEMDAPFDYLPKHAAFSAQKNATLDAVLGNITLAPLFYKDTQVVNFDKAIKMAIAMNTGQALHSNSVHILAVRPNTKLAPHEFFKMKGDVGAIKSNTTFKCTPTVQIYFKVEGGILQGEQVVEMTQTLQQRIEDGKLLQAIQAQLDLIGIKIRYYETPTKVFNKKIDLIRPNSKKDKIKYPEVRNVTLGGCHKVITDRTLDDRNVGPLKWTTYLGVPRTEISFKGPFTAMKTMDHTKEKNTMKWLDFSGGQMLAEMKVTMGSVAPGGTLLYMGGNATCNGLAIFVKGASMGVGNTCASDMETSVDMGLTAGKSYTLKMTYQWGKVKLYKNNKMVKMTTKRFVLPKAGNITVGAGGHNNGQGKFTSFGKIENVLIKSDAAVYSLTRPKTSMVTYNCTDMPCRGDWYPKDMECVVNETKANSTNATNATPVVAKLPAEVQSLGEGGDLSSSLVELAEMPGFL